MVTNANVRRLIALTIVTLALTGCGKEGPPVPPERRLPQVISDLTGAVEGNRIVLSWTNPSKRADQSRLRDLTTLRIYRREERGDAPAKPALISWGQVVGYDQIAEIKLDSPAPAEVEGQRLRWGDTTAVTGRRYVYVVTATDSIGRASPPSNRLDLVALSAPKPPERLQARPGENQVMLSWSAPTSTIDGSPLREPVTYQLLRAQTLSEPYQPVGEPTANLAVTDTNLQNEQSYYYAVRAIRSQGSTKALSEQSLPVTATPVDLTPPPPPSNLVAVPAEGSVRLAWDPSRAPDVAGYRVYRATAPTGEFSRVNVTDVSATVFVDRTVERGTSYRYAVTAIDQARKPNESPRSEEISVTVPR
jgi:fibronectin type 3 domain-containing protein